MSTLSRSVRTRVRAFLAAVLVGVVTWACTEGAGVTDGARTIGVDLLPQYQVVPSPFDSAPIDHIRLRAIDTATRTVVGEQSVAVDPAQSQWVLTLGIELGGAPSREVIVEVELLAGTSVEWSGRTVPFTVRYGPGGTSRTVDIFRGPLDNLDVLSLEIGGAPARMLVGSVATLTADVEIPIDSDAVPVVFWASGNPTVATVTPTGATSTLTALAPGTVSIVAGAGPGSDAVSVEVLPRVSAVVVTPPVAMVDGPTGTVQFTAEVLDGFGDPDATAQTTWSSTNAAVATVDASGLAAAAGFGVTQIQATSGGVVGSATLTVRGPDLVPTAFSVLPDAGGEVRFLAATELDVQITNAGPVAAGASTLRVRVLDAETGEEAHPPLVFDVPALAAAGVFTLRQPIGAQAQPVALPGSIRFEAAVDALGAVAETNETNNTAVAGPFGVVPPAPPGFDVEWIGTTPAWGTGSNWSTGQPPQAGQSVFIAQTGVDPLLSSDARVAALTITAGATLTITDGTSLTATGNVDAGRTIVGPGRVVLAGVGMTVQGSILAPVVVTGAVSVAAGLTTGDLVITGAGASFRVNGQAVTVQGALTTDVGGVLVMQNAAGALQVAGDATFSGGSTEGLLTGGALEVGGDLVALDSDPRSFAASLAHAVRMTGGRSHDITLVVPGQTTQRFANLRLDNAANVSALSGLVVTGTLELTSGSSLDAGDRQVSVGTGLVDPDGGLAPGALGLIGGLQTLPFDLPYPVVVDGPVTWPGDASLGSTLTVDASLSLGPNDVSVGSSVFVNGSLTVPAGGSMAIAGVLTLGSGSTLTVDGTVTAAGGCTDNGASSITGTGVNPCAPTPGGTRTWVGNPAGTPANWGNGAHWSPAGVPSIDDDVVIPAIPSSPILDGTRQVASLTVASGAYVDMGSNTLEVYGDLEVAGALIGGTVDLYANGRALRGNLDALVLRAPTALTGYLSLSGSLDLDAALTVGTYPLLLGGNLSVTGPNARLVMSDPQSVVAVAGTALFDGASHDGFLTGGALILSGDFQSVGGSFAASGGHVTIANGPATQSFDFGPAGLGALQSLNVEGVGVTIASDVTARGSVFVAGTLTVPAGRALSIGAELNLGPQSTLAVDGTVTAAGGCINGGATIIGTGTHPCGPPPAGRVWIGGDAGGPTLWSNANNWTPPIVPGASDDVRISGAPNQPVLTAPMTVGSLLVDGGSSIDLAGLTLAVVGDVAVDGVISNGVVELTGPGSVLRGAFDALRVSADRGLSGVVTAAGDVTVNDADLAILGSTLRVLGSLAVNGGTGVLVMQTPGGLVDVDGDVLCGGGGSVGLLSAGELRVGGDFTQTQAASSNAFVSTGTTVIFDGQGTQTVSFATPGTALSRFRDVTFENLGTVVFASDVVALGTVDVIGGSPIDASDDVVSIGGAYNDDGNDMRLGTLRVVGDLTSLPPSVAADVIVDADFALPSSLDVTGNVTLNNFDLTIGPNTLTVGGNLFVNGGNAQLVMQSPASVVDVEGGVAFNGGGEDGFLTAGVLRVADDFAATGANSNLDFVSTGTLVVFDSPESTQTVSFSNPAPNLQRFRDVTFANQGAVVFATDVVATGVVTLSGSSQVNGQDDVISIGGAWVDPNDRLVVQELRVIGDLTAVPPVVNADVRVDAAFTLPASWTVNGSVTLDNFDLIVGPNTLNVTGDLTVNGGNAQLDLRNAGNVVDVDGNVTFNGGGHAGFLTQGELRVGGDFTATNTNTSQAFVSTGTTVRFDGVGATQTVSFASPATNLSRFQNVLFVQGGPAVFATDVVAMGTFQVGDASTVDASAVVVSVGGALVDAGSGLSAREIRIVGNLTEIPSTLASDVRVDAAFTLPSDLDVSGDFTVNNASFTLGGNRLFVVQDFSTAGGGARLVMTSRTDSLDVAGSVRFDGGSETGALTEGVMRVAGDFVAGSTNSATSYVAEGNHQTILLGTGVQRISFASPGVATQRFNHLTHRNFSGAVELATTAVVTGTFIADDVALQRPAGTQAVLDLRGRASLNAVTITRLPVRLTSLLAGPQHTFNDVTFTQMAAADVQLYLELPGGANFPLLITGMAFDTPNFLPGAGHIQTVRGAGGFPAELFSVNAQNTTPRPLVVIQGTGTQVLQL